MVAIFHIKSREDNNHCLELRFYFNDKHQHIVRDTLGDWIIYYRGQANERYGYFAAARVFGIYTTDIQAYSMECAMTGISMQAPDGTYDIQSEHIMPVEAGGPDSVSNGIALSRCLHWMFDKGLISIDADYRILRSHHYFQPQIDRLFIESGRINLPNSDSDRPHPEFLRYHRDNIFRR